METNQWIDGFSQFAKALFTGQFILSPQFTDLYF